MRNGYAPTRREAMAFAAAGALAALLAPRLAVATEEQVTQELEKLYAGKAKSLSESKVTLDVPEIAENGLVVPVNVEVESPMTENDYVKAVHIFADGNPLPRVISYHFTPACGRAAAAARMRLAKTQNVIAVAEMADGSLYTAKKQIKVTIGGCGG